MPFLKPEHHLLGRALTGPLSDAATADLISRVAPNVQFLAAAACVWNPTATVSDGTLARWQTQFPASLMVWKAIQNHTAFPQCKRGHPHRVAPEVFGDSRVPGTAGTAKHVCVSSGVHCLD
tara:strand:+ start:1958 stop:2320 length:363 start_codon:yes stop_codon:yes gene_type:complete